MTSNRSLKVRRTSHAIVAAIVIAFLSVPCASAQEPTQPSVAVDTQITGGEPARVDVGVFFIDIHDIDFINDSFGAEFYMWWISPDPNFKPFDEVQILNGRDWKFRTVTQRKLPNGRYHTSGIVSATIKHDWQLLYFPFDRQDLGIIIEVPETSNELRFVPDKEKSTISKLMNVEGFHVSGISLEERVERYNTDFGIGSTGDSYSRLIINVALDRQSGRLVVAMLIGFIVANIIALLTFAIPLTYLGVRTSMVGSAIFGAVGNMYSISNTLSPAVGSLLIDRFAIGTFSAIVVALLNSIIVERLATKGRSRLAHQVNRIVFYVALVAIVIFYAATFATALSGRT